MGFATDCIHAGQEPDPTTGAVTVPIYQTSTYVQEGLGQHKGYEYARAHNHPAMAQRADEILDDLDMAVSGFALDLGVLWQRPGSRFAAGADLRDGGFVGGEALDSGIGLGVSWQALAAPAGPVRGVLLAADLRDVFGGDGQAMGNRIHLGAEMGLPVISLRTGFNQDYPTVGASVALRVLNLDYAFYGRELGNFPGSESQFLHAVEMRLGF